MPIYAYRCSACGHAKDVLQKLSDPVLSTCPACSTEAFAKQVTAAGFQLKGSGWYATDFKGGGAAAAPSEATPDAKPGAKPDGGGSGGSEATAAPSAPSASAASTASAAPCGGSCACH